MVKILIADDHAIVRNGLVKILADSPDAIVVDEASNWEEALAKVDGGDFNAEKYPHEKLSNREYEVMCMIGAGKSVTEIAVEISLSVKTISTFRARILHKMNMKNNSELTHYAIGNKLVD